MLIEPITQTPETPDVKPGTLILQHYRRKRRPQQAACAADPNAAYDQQAFDFRRFPVADKKTASRQKVE
jgi:hypothetical protein